MNNKTKTTAKNNGNKLRYDNLDVLRVIACFCIIAMHINANASFNLNPLVDGVIKSWTHFVALFLIISGFGMFCGYYDKFKEGQIDLNSFYMKRYKKLLPFFISLILIDIIIERSFSHIIEGFVEATLVFGLLPNLELDVIGVSWTLGVIFLFYMLFPFVVFLCENKRRATISFLISIIISLLCTNYFFTNKFVLESFTPRHNILYCAPYFLSGAVVYLNIDKIKNIVNRNKVISFVICLLLTIAWYVVPGKVMEIDYLIIKNLILFLAWFIFMTGIDKDILNNSIVKYLSGISFELYLSHMILFRLIEKANILYIFGNGIIGYIFACVLTIVLAIVFIKVWKRITKTLFSLYNKKFAKQ